MRGLVYSITIGSALLTLQPAQAVTISEQTPVQIRLMQELKSGHERKGDQVQFEVAQELKSPNGELLVAAGTPVVGTVTRANGRGLWGKPGRLEFTADYIRLGEQTRVPLRCEAIAGHGRNNAAASITTAVLIAPVALFVKGREVTFDKGKEFTVYVDQTTDLGKGTTTAATTSGTGTMTTAQAFTFDPKRASLIKYKTGLIVVGTVWEFKDCTYTVATELGKVLIPQEKIESITDQPAKQ